MGENLPIDLKPLRERIELGGLHGQHRVAVFCIPRGVTKQVVGLATRLSDIAITTDPYQMRDVMFYAMMVGVFAETDLVRKMVENAYLDQTSPLSYNIILVLRSGFTIQDLSYAVINYCNMNAENLGIDISGEQGVGGGGGEGDGDGGGGGEGGGAPAAAAASTPARRPAKRAKKNLQASADMRRAHGLVNHAEVPVFRISQYGCFAESFITWGKIICGKGELNRCMACYLCNRLEDLGYTVTGDPYPSKGNANNNAPPGPPTGGGGGGDDAAGEGGGLAANGMDSDAEDAPVHGAGQFNLAVNANVGAGGGGGGGGGGGIGGGGGGGGGGHAEATTAHMDGNTTMYSYVYTPRMGAADDGVFDTSLAAIINPDHPITSQFMCFETDGNGSYMLNPSEYVSRFRAPQTDLPFLAERYLAPSALFNKFNLFSDETRYYDNKTNANTIGDLEVLTQFLSKYKFDTTDNLGVTQQAALLTFDVMSRREGRLPKSIAESMTRFHMLLNQNNGFISTLVPVPNGAPEGTVPYRTMGTDTPVIRYKNLSYSGNYLLYMLKNFERSGSFYFHCEQMYIMMILDSVCFRKLDGAKMAGMAAHMIAYGPPGIGKSTAMLLFIEAYEKTLKANSYSSARSIYSDLRSSDQMDNKAMIHDECPSFIVQSDGGAKSSTQERDLIAQLKERLTSAAMNGERLVRDEETGKYITKDYNVKLLCSPFLANTNAAEQSGHGPLLDRFITRFFTYKRRTLAHTLQAGAEDPADVAHRAKFVRELELHRTLMLVVTKMQSDKVILEPDISAFRNFYANFIAELKACPYLNIDPPSASDRKSSIVELLFCHLVTRMAIHRLYFEPGTPMIEKKFSVEDILEINKYMAMGDTQTAIIAVGALSHAFRSPTEYACAQMFAENIISWNNEQFDSIIFAEQHVLDTKAAYDAAIKVMTDLVSRGGCSQKELDDAKAARETAERDYSAARENHAGYKNRGITVVNRERAAAAQTGGAGGSQPPVPAPVSIQPALQKPASTIYSYDDEDDGDMVQDDVGAEEMRIAEAEAIAAAAAAAAEVPEVRNTPQNCDVSFKVDNVMFPLTRDSLAVYPWSFENYVSTGMNTVEMKKLMANYCFVTNLYNSPPDVYGQCGRLATFLNESHKGENSQLLHDHVQRRLLLFATKGVRTGPHVGERILRFVDMPSSSRVVGVFVLRHWLVECTQTREFSMLRMMERAVKRCAHATPGTHLVLEPLRLGDVPDVVEALDNSYDERLNTNIFQLTPYFHVPIHEVGCPARDEQVERNLPNVFDRAVHWRADCKCFRSTGKGVSVDNVTAEVDPNLVAYANISKLCGAARPVNLGVPGEIETAPRVEAYKNAVSYPIDAIRLELTRGGRVVTGREASNLEMQCLPLFQRPEPETISPLEALQQRLNALMHMQVAIAATAKPA